MKSQLKKIASLFLSACVALTVMAVIPFAATEESKTISFASTANRVSQSGTQQVWSQNGITVTNDKGSSTSAVADFYNPVRFYQGSKVTIEYPGMTKIVFDLNTEKSKASDLVTSIGTAATAVADSNSQCTVTFATPVDSFVINSLSKQTRVKNITVYYEAATGGDDNQGGDEGGNEGSGETPNPNPNPNPSVTTEVELTVDSLGLPDQSYTAGTKTVGGADFEWIQLGNYGDGIQVRDKNGNTSSLWNTAAFSAPIKEIRLVYSDTQEVTYSNPDMSIFSFGNAADNLTNTVKLSTVAGTKTYTVTPDEETYTFFKFEHDLGYTSYWKSITIVLAGDVAGGEGDDDDQGGLTPTPNPSLPIPDATNTLTIEQAIELAQTKDHNTFTDEKYYVTGVITSIYETYYGNMYIVDEEGNTLTIYGTYSADGELRYGDMTSKPDAGDTVTLYGIIGKYGTASQMKNAWIIEFTPGELEEENNDPADGTVLTIPEAIELGETKLSNIYTENKYYVTGTITGFYGDQGETYGNIYITDEDGNQILVYGTWSEDGTVKYGDLEVKPQVGDIVTVYGVVGNYNGTAQMKNGWFKAAPVDDEDEDQGGSTTPPAGDEDEDQGGSTTPPAGDEDDDQQGTTGDDNQQGTTGDGDANADNSGEGDNVEAPDTGDNMNVVAYIVVMLLAGAAVVVTKKVRA